MHDHPCFLRKMPPLPTTVRQGPPCRNDDRVQREAAGTFRVESTGFSGSEKRTLIATFRNANFVSFIWYDEYETGDPVLYGEKRTQRSRVRRMRPVLRRTPKLPLAFDNYFISGETIKGPMHTEDHVGISGNPMFGRDSSDQIDFGHRHQGDSGIRRGSRRNGDSPFRRRPRAPNEVPSMKPPPGDEELEHIVEKNTISRARRKSCLKATR